MRKSLKNNRAASFRALYSASWWLLSAILLLSACAGPETSHEHDTYTCPMHPTVVSDRPSTCPVCGMDLVRKARPGEEVEITEELSRLLKSPSHTIIANIRTIRAEYTRMEVAQEVDGVVSFDPRYVYSVPARISGRIENFAIKYAYQFVKKGQKVAEIYSPEMATAQRELLFLMENDSENGPMIGAAKERLVLLGATNAQIERIMRRKQIESTFAVFSPHDGYVLPDETEAASVRPISSPAGSMSPMPGNAMGGAETRNTSRSGMTTGSQSPDAPGVGFNQGDYVAAGQSLFRLVNPSSLRIELSVPGSKRHAIKNGNSVTLDFGDGTSGTGVVDFVQPFFTDGQDFVTVRLYTRDSEKLSIGQLVRATIQGDSIEGMWVPRDAVLDLGVEQIIFFRNRNVFEPKKVQLAESSGKYVRVMGLTSSDEIAENAQYMVDSESFIRIRK